METNLLLTKLFYHGQILLLRHLHRERQHDAPGKLGVPLVLHGFHGVPERCPVCISGRRMGRQHDFGMDEFFLLVVEFRFLVVLAEQPFAALVSGPGNSGLPLAALDDGDFEMRTRNRHHPQTKRPPSKIALDERSGIAVQYNAADNTYALCPLFDNGLSLLADTNMDFPFERSLEDCLKAVEAKPFSRYFDDQLDAAEELYGIQLHFNFNTNDVKVLIDSYRIAYSQEICDRCEALIRRQMLHYGYLVR